jgi:hypothetical protein
VMEIVLLFAIADGVLPRGDTCRRARGTDHWVDPLPRRPSYDAVG